MADSSNNGGQMNFDADLSSLAEFIKKLQDFSGQVSTVDPDIKKLTKSFNELNKMIQTLNTSFTGLNNMSAVSGQLKQMISVIEKMQTGMSKLNTDNNGIKNLAKDIKNLEVVIQNMTGISTYFNAILEQVGQTPGISSKELTTYFKNLEKTINLTTNSLRSLIDVSKHLSEFAAQIDNLVKMFDSLLVLTSRYNQLMGAGQMPKDAAQTQQYFKELFVLIDNVCISFQQLGMSNEGIGNLARGLNAVGDVVKNLTTLMEKFEVVLRQDLTVPQTENLTNYFNQLFTVVSKVEKEFNQMVGTSRGLDDFVHTFTSMNTVMNSIAASAHTMEALIQNTTEVPDSANLLQYFKNLMNIMNQLEAEINQAGDSFKGLQSVTRIFREISNSMQEVNRLSIKFGDPKQVEAMEKQYVLLLQMLKNLIKEVNAMELDTDKFALLNKVLQNLTQTLNAANMQMSYNIAQQQKTGVALETNQKKAAGFSAIFAGAFGSRNTGMLNNFYHGITRLTFGVQGLMVAFGGRAMWEFFIGYNQQIEVLQTSLEVTLKSARAAEDAIRSLRSYAALTPFLELETFKSGEMLAANRMDIDRWIRVAGDLASAKRTAGVKLEDVVNVLTRINSGDFGKAMIRLRQMGISINDLREKGLEFTRNNTFKGTTDEFLNVIEQIVEERYGGLTEALGSTVEGLISTIKDFFMQLGIELGEGAFGDLKSWLKDIKSDLLDLLDPTSQAGQEFEDMVEDFNKAVESMERFFGPFVGLIKIMVGGLSEGLPLIAKLAQILITMKIASSILTAVTAISRNSATMGTNLVTINSLMADQVAKVDAENLAINASIRKLTEMEKATARINVLRQAGNKILTEEQAKIALNAELQKMTASRVAYTQIKESIRPGVSDILHIGDGVKEGNQTIISVNEKLGESSKKVGDGIEKLEKSNQKLSTSFSKGLTGSIEKATVALAGFGTSLGAKIPQLMAAVVTLQLVGSAVTGVVKMFKGESDQLKVTSEDYDRVIGQRLEEIRYIETLQTTRNAAINNLRIYGEALEDLEKNSENVAYSEERHAKYTGELTDAKNELVRINEQLMTVDASLAEQLTDSTGRLNDETGAYEANTAAIEKNILTRKNKIADMYEEQLDAAKAEKKLLQKEIEDTKGFEEGLTTNKFNAWTSKIMYTLGSIIMEPDDLHFSNYSKQYAQGERAAAGTKEDKEQALNKIQVENYERQQKIQSLDKLIREDAEAKKLGFVIKGTNTIDLAKYRTWQKHQEEQRKIAEGRLEASTLTFENILSEGESGLSKVEQEYEVKLNDILLKNGNNKDDQIFQDMEKAKVDAYSEHVDSLIEDLDMVYDQAKAGTEVAMEELSSGLRELADSNENFTAAEIISALDYFEDSHGQMLSRFKDYSEAVKQLYEDLNRQGKSHDFITAIMNDYDTFKEVKKTYEDSREKLLLKKQKQQLSLLSSGSSSKSPYDLFNEKWEKERKMKDLSKDIVLQRDEIAGYDEDSGKYTSDKKIQNQQIITFIYREMDALKSLMNSSAFKKSKDYEKEKYEAQVQLLQLEKEANSLLLDIRENTSKVGEFNKPGFVKALTYYDYKSRDAVSSTVEFSDAKFILQVSAPQTMEDINAMWELIKKNFGDYIKKNEGSGVRNNFLYR